MVSAKRIDPSGTGLLVRGMTRMLLAKFARLGKAVYQWVAIDDELGLGQGDSGRAFAITMNARFRFATAANKMKGFEEWFKAQVDAGVLSEDDSGFGDLTGTKYIKSAYKKAAVDTYIALNRKKFKSDKDPAFLAGKEQFLRDAFDSSEATSKMQLLATRTYSALKDVTSTMDASMSRILAQGIADGRNPREVGRQMAKEVEGLGKKRAVVIARTEMIHVHAEGSLDAYEALGQEGVSVMAEWLVTPDKRLCPLCTELSGIVMTVKEARGLLPRHPNCRCTWIPADVGENKKGQIRTKAGKGAAIERSVRLEKPNKDAADAFALSRWKGADSKLVPKPQPAPIIPAIAPSAELWGNQPTAVMRWMGKEGWSPQEASKVLKEMGVDGAEATVKIQVRAGATGQRGAAAALTEEQATILRAKRIGAPTPPTVPPIAPPIVPPPPVIAPPVIPPPPVGTLVPIPPIDQSATSVARWLGKEGFDFKDAKKAVEEAGFKISDATLKIHLKAGTTGARGAAATLTDAQAAALRLRKTSGRSIDTIVKPPIKPPSVKVPAAPKLPPTPKVPPAPKVPATTGPGKQPFNRATILEDLNTNKEVDDLYKQVKVHADEVTSIAQKAKDAQAAVDKARPTYAKVIYDPDINHPDKLRYFKLIKEQREAEEAFKEAQKTINAKIHKILELPEAERVKISLIESTDFNRYDVYTNGTRKVKEKDVFAPASAAVKAKHAEAQEFLQKMTRKAGRAGGDASDMSLSTKTYKRSGRAFYQGDKYGGRAAVHMAKDDDTRVHVHEILHHYENAVPGAKDRSNAFIEARIDKAGTPDESMKELFGNGYSERESGNEDGFGKFWGKGSSSAYYAGKRYEDASTEIVSMAGQELYRDPVGLATKDPELFKFIVGFLRGSY